MLLSEFHKQSRGPRRFDTWIWEGRLNTVLGQLQVLLSLWDRDAPPDVRMVEAASELSVYVVRNAQALLDLIYAHYRLALAEGWLDPTGVPPDVSREAVLTYVDGLELDVGRTNDPARPFDLCLSARIRWDAEHDLQFIYWDGKLISVNNDAQLLLTLQELAYPGSSRRS